METDQRENVAEMSSTDEENSKQTVEPMPEKSNVNIDKTKKKKRGIIYLSSIPKHMNLTIAKEIFSQYADVGRMFFEPQKMPDSKNKNNKKRRRSRFFSEGWIEFESKKAAKEIAAQLNNTEIASRKSSKFYGILWNIKYLPRFKWIHLTERLTYEREVHKHKLRAELALARREATFFQDNLDRRKKVKTKNKS